MPGYDAVYFETAPRLVNIQEKDIPLIDAVGEELIVTDQETWSDVVLKMLPNYSVSDETIDFVRDQATDYISTIGSLEKQIIACINHVQNQIRYLSFDEPIHFHQPYPVEKTIENRFGDCKDKSLLLVVMLRSLGIEAFPVLVNRNYPEYPSQIISGFAFNYVVVLIPYQGQNYWIDPCCEFEAGDLDKRGSTVKGYGLVLSDTTTDVVLIEPNMVNHSVVVEHLDFSEVVSGVVKLTVQSSFSGAEASRLRAFIADVGEDQHSPHCFEFYKKKYAGLAAVDFSVRDDMDENVIRINESYFIENIQQDLDPNGFLYLFPQGIAHGVKLPDEGRERIHAIS